MQFVPLRDADLTITLNPYQGLKHWNSATVVHTWRLTITLNPYQGLKRYVCGSTVDRPILTITLNPYQGLKHLLVIYQFQSARSYNYLESLSGIETAACRFNAYLNFSLQLP